MRAPIVVPDVGPGNESLIICSWLFDEGDFVVSGDSVAEILIPGVVFEIAAEASGRLVELTQLMDAKVATGDIIGWLDDEIATASQPIAKADE
jgi:pyruvate/2-oxoglutarate dehydrogenase complex dihydrolipoamide acyltransferase (E2) component